MSNYIVSARKYRPQNFNTVVGQGHITTTLKNAIMHNQLAHAFLFCGPRGVGKTTCARILAKTINCTNITSEGEACNQCESCLNFEQGVSFNIHEIDAASNNKSEDIRELIEQVRYAPVSGKYKIFIIDEGHMLSTSAFNVFLKTLEEPPHYAIFILATTEKNKIIPTILSRCQIFDFKRINTKDTVNLLQDIAQKEDIKVEKEALELIALKSEGCLRDSLSLLDKIVSFTNGNVNYENTIEHLNILDEDVFFELLTYLQEEKLGDALILFDKIYNKGFEGNVFINGFQSFLRNVLVAKNIDTNPLLEVIDSFKEKYFKAAQETDIYYILTVLNILNEADIHYKESYNKRLHVELLLMKLAYLQKAISVIEDETDTVQKKKQFEQNKILQFRKIGLVKKMKEKIVDNIQPNTIKPEGSTNVASQPKTETKLSLDFNDFKKILDDDKSDLLKAVTRIVDKQNIQTIKESLPLEINKLKEIWNNYIILLASTNRKMNANNLGAVKFNILDGQKIELIFSSNIAKSMFETDKKNLLQAIKDGFNNNSIYVTSIIKPEKLDEEVPLHQRLNTQEKYDLMIKNNPLIAELKTKLQLAFN